MGSVATYTCDRCGETVERSYMLKDIYVYKSFTHTAGGYHTSIGEFCTVCFGIVVGMVKEEASKGKVINENSSTIRHAQSPYESNCSCRGRVGICRGLYDLWKKVFSS